MPASTPPSRPTMQQHSPLHWHSTLAPPCRASRPPHRAQGLPWPGVLWGIAPKLVIFLVGYTLVGTWLTTSAFGKRLMQLDFRLLQQAGDLRFGLVRTREHAGGPLPVSVLRL